MPLNLRTRQVFRVTTVLLGLVFFSAVAYVHGVTATAAGSIAVLGLLWLFAPAPLVFLARVLGRLSKRLRVASTAYLALSGVLSVGVLLGVGWIGSERGIHPTPCADLPQLEDYPSLQSDLEDAKFQSGDGTQLKGWFIAGESRATVILLHGYGCRKEAMLPHAEMLHDAGYSVLLFDFRGRGESGGDAVTLGYLERGDVHGAVEYLGARPDVDSENIGVLGVSMGGATAILAAAEIPELKAVVSESGFKSANSAIAQSFEHFIGLPAFPFAPVTVFIIERRLGIDTGEVVPQAAVSRISPRPVFIIHGADDRTIDPADGEALHASARPPKQDLWIIPGAAHAEGIDVAPEEYTARVVGFFDEYLDFRDEAMTNHHSPEVAAPGQRTGGTAY